MLHNWYMVDVINDVSKLQYVSDLEQSGGKGRLAVGGKVDVAGLYAALDARRKERGLSWRQVAFEAGVSPSLLSRMANHHRPDLDGFVALIHWLGVEAETFMVVPEGHARRVGDLATEVSLLLRAHRDLDDADRQHLQDVVESALRHIRAMRDNG
jgi:transcriptional regulator with XRE-family HTH domain